MEKENGEQERYKAERFHEGLKNIRQNLPFTAAGNLLKIKNEEIQDN